MSTVWLNDRFLPAEQARVSVLDRGFLFGDGVYEVIPVYGGRPFRLQRHLRRLERSLAAVGIDNPATRDQWTARIDELVERNGGGDQGVYLQVTRGVAPRQHVPEGELEPTVLLMSNPLPPRSGIARVSAVTLPDDRWGHCDIKSIALLASVLLRIRARGEGAGEAILLRDGELTEGAASNVFTVLDGVVVTPPVSPRLLPGITREVLLELLRKAGIEAEERPVSEQELRNAREIWLTSSTQEITAVTMLDGREIGDGRPGPTCRRADELYQEYKRLQVE
ncbi:MAG: D-amino acid aminotransferase [Gammaproteobacteria bacterium]|nr:MAG: D-amino acid aminotransferase [Gammaproteobacteria bacterium]